MAAYRRPSSNHSNPFADFATFRMMLTPWLVVAVFWVGTAVCILGGGRIAVGAFETEKPREVERDWTSPTKKGERIEREKPGEFSAVQLAGGLMVMLVGPLVLRLACEFEIVVFALHREVKQLNDRVAASM
ncbi:MAG: DUF4282 domain-containing protein [Gemmataceae bacterium]